MRTGIIQARIDLNVTKHMPGGTWLALMAGPLLLSGCATTQQDRISHKPMLFQAEPATVFVADGAGNFQMASKSLRTMVECDGYPIDVITYEWSHGDRRVVADQIDYPHAKCEGKKLAAMMEDYHAAHPQRPIYLLGHSAGCMVITAALEAVSPNVVERAILLAPSMSAYYDLSPALRSVKQELHNFYSHRDRFMLGVNMHIFGTSDRLWTATAGRVGFRTPTCLLEPGQTHKLVQHGWQPKDRQLGHNGGHFDGYQPEFLRQRIIPLLNPHAEIAE